jgi:sterol desaturase/sphingolipid hydroxylase (fatty acid hydroxylase superfamily)
MLFGTMHLPKSEWPQSYGIAEPVPDGYLRQLAWPFRHAHHDRPG